MNSIATTAMAVRLFFVLCLLLYRPAVSEESSYGDDGGDTDATTAAEGQDTDECFRVMWPPDGYEVTADELEGEFVAMLRINCPGVSPAVYVEWSEGGRERGGVLDAGAESQDKRRIRVEKPAAGADPDELLEISVYLKRGSRVWQWRVGREDGSGSEEEHHILILPLLRADLTLAFPPRNFQFRAAVRPFIIATIHEPLAVIQRYGYPRFFHNITVHSPQYVKSHRCGRAEQRIYMYMPYTHTHTHTHTYIDTYVHT